MQRWATALAIMHAYGFTAASCLSLVAGSIDIGMLNETRYTICAMDCRSEVETQAGQYAGDG
jgi:hypothetical protein